MAKAKMIRIKDWKVCGNIVTVSYDDGTDVHVNTLDFNRAFGAIINATKEEVVRDFAI